MRWRRPERRERERVGRGGVGGSSADGKANPRVSDPTQTVTSLEAWLRPRWLYLKSSFLVGGQTGSVRVSGGEGENLQRVFA